MLSKNSPLVKGLFGACFSLKVSATSMLPPVAMQTSGAVTQLQQSAVPEYTDISSKTNSAAQGLQISEMNTTFTAAQEVHIEKITKQYLLSHPAILVEL